MMARSGHQCGRAWEGRFAFLLLIPIALVCVGCQHGIEIEETTPKKERPLFRVQSGGKFGYIDSAGHIAIKPQFDDARAFSEGMAAVRVGSCLASTTFAGQRQLFLRINDNYTLDEFPMA